MTEKYWSMFTRLKHYEFYYKNYSKRLDLLIVTVNCFCCVICLASVSSWVIWKAIPSLWAVIVGAVQILQACLPFLSSSKKSAALHFLVKEIELLLVDVDSEWSFIGTYDDTKAKKMIAGYEKRYLSLCSQYLGDMHIHQFSCIEKIAEKNCRLYFSHRYNVCELQEVS